MEGKNEQMRKKENKRKGKKEQEINKTGKERIKEDNEKKKKERCKVPDEQLLRSYMYTKIRDRLRTSSVKDCLSPYLPTACESCKLRVLRYEARGKGPFAIPITVYAHTDFDGYLCENSPGNEPRNETRDLLN
jgi:hypothetical protein